MKYLIELVAIKGMSQIVISKKTERIEDIKDFSLNVGRLQDLTAIDKEADLQLWIQEIEEVEA